MIPIGDGASTTTVAATLVLLLSLVAAIWMYLRSGKISDKTKFTKKSSKAKFDLNEHGAQCVWEERRRKGIKLSSSNQRATVGDDKPFGSSYYYAHNNQNTKGGYQDGLRMEDYTMNQPRLLSRGGKPVDNSSSDPSPSGTVLDKTQTEEPNLKEPETRQPISWKRVIPISKYLWDDPGDSKGIATLRIDSLPSHQGNAEPIPWKDIVVTDTSAELEGDGLVVTVETESDVDYQLRIAQLHGAVEKVALIKKTKRLLVQLHKQKRPKSNLEAWPQPHKKIA